MRIMVVEDDRRTADYLRHGLMEAGHVVDSSGSGTVRINFSPLNEQHVDLYLWREEDGLLRGDQDPKYDWPGLRGRTAFPRR